MSMHNFVQHVLDAPADFGLIVKRSRLFAGVLEPISRVCIRRTHQRKSPLGLPISQDQIKSQELGRESSTKEILEAKISSDHSGSKYPGT